MIREKKLLKYRKKIDTIDNAIFLLIKRRTKIVKNMLTLKKNKKEIIDKKRMNLIYAKIRRKSIENKIDPKITNKIWKSIILSYIDYQRRNFKKK